MSRYSSGVLCGNPHNQNCHAYFRLFILLYELSLSLSHFLSGGAVAKGVSSLATGLALSSVLLTSVTARAQTTLPPPYQRDGEIYFVDESRVPFPGMEFASDHCLQANSRLEYIGKNRRTVGTGFVGETVNANGALIGSETLIRNGLLSRDARIRVHIHGNCGMGGGGLSARVFVNEETPACLAKEALVFSQFPVEVQQDFVLHFDAACLRYGVRESADAPEPTAKENRIIVVPDSPPTQI